MTRKILLFGKDGQVGSELLPCLQDVGTVVAMGRLECDMSDDAQIASAVHAVRPDVIINATAYTAVDKAEQQVLQAELINARAVGTLARAARDSAALLIHYSTDYVYAGDKSAPYVESDATGPRSVYGRSKLAGEDLIREYCPAHFIFRTSWVFGLNGDNFLKTILGLIQQRDSLGVVADQHGTPTSADLIARTTREIVGKYLEPASFNPERFGTYHLVADGVTTWHGYARLIAQLAQEMGLATKIKPDSIASLSTQQYPLPAPRPANSRLDTSKLKWAFGLELPRWEDDVRRVLEQLLQR